MRGLTARWKSGAQPVSSKGAVLLVLLWVAALVASLSATVTIRGNLASARQDQRAALAQARLKIAAGDCPSAEPLLRRAASRRSQSGTVVPAREMQRQCRDLATAQTKAIRAVRAGHPADAVIAYLDLMGANEPEGFHTIARTAAIALINDAPQDRGATRNCATGSRNCTVRRSWSGN